MNRPPSTDEQLMLAVAASEDEAALAELYDRYAARVFGLAYKIVEERGTAEDIMQEVFWRLWKHRARFQAQRGSVRSWLFAMARNLAIDRTRRRAHRPQPLENEEALFLFEQRQDPDQHVPSAAGTAVEHERVLAALRLLDADQRQVLELAYFRGLTRREIAEVTDTPLGTVHTRARRGLLKLRQLLTLDLHDDA